MKISHLPDLKRQIQKIVRGYASEKFPYELYFNQGMEFPEFKFTIEKMESDTFVDSRGQKWVKVKEKNVNR